MKLAIAASTNYLDFPLGGTLYFLKNYIYELDDDVILFGIQTDNDGIFPDNLNFIPIYKKQDKTNRYFPLRLHLFIHSILNKNKILKQKFNTIYIHSPELLLVFIKKNRNYKIIFHMHGATNPIRYSKYRIFRTPIAQIIYQKIFSYLLSKVDIVVGVNNECYIEYQNIFDNNNIKFYLIPINVNTTIFQPITDENYHDTNVIKMIYVGRLSYVKNIDYQISIVNELVQRGIDCRLDIIGDGELREQLTNRIDKLGLEDKVILHGRVEHEKLPLLLSNSTLFILTSFTEGLPLSIIEALSCGIPIVSNDLPAIRRIINENPNAGRVISDFSIDQYIDAILYYSNNQINRYDLHEYIINKYSSTTIAKKISEILQ